jgi:hypothetical protein
MGEIGNLWSIIDCCGCMQEAGLECGGCGGWSCIEFISVLQFGEP